MERATQTPASNGLKIMGDLGPPCLSLYQQTHRHHPDNQQDPIRFRNLVKSLEQSLAQHYSEREVSPVMNQFRKLADDVDFWNHTRDGLAVLAAPGYFQTFRFARRTPELAVVADSFHLKPLLRILQSTDRYQVLGLSRGQVRLFEGSRDALDELELAPGVPRSLTEALGEELTGPHLTVASYGRGPRPGPAMRHGHGSRKEEIKKDEERFFRVVDRSILEHHSHLSRVPLLLAALPEHHALFRRISHNPFLLPEGIRCNPDSLDRAELRECAWRVLRPHYEARLAALSQSFVAALSKGRGGSDLQEITAATLAGRTDTLLVEADRIVPGCLDPGTGRAQFEDLANPAVDDALDDLAELVLNRGGQIAVVPASHMPSPTGAAAIYRY